MNPIALSQIGVRVPLDTLKEIDNAMLNLTSLIEWGGNLGGIVKEENVVTNDGKRWSYYIQDFTVGLPFSPTIYISTQQELPKGQKPYEIYITDVVDGLKPSEITHWFTQIPGIIKKIIQEDLEKFSD